VPDGLEAICSKAMALRPADRYASALDLAGDIARWLADEAVTAWREPWKERVQRLARKHVNFVAGAAAGLTLVLILVYPVYTAISIYYQHQHLAEKQRESEAITAKTNSDIASNKAYVEKLQKDTLLQAKATDEQLKALNARGEHTSVKRHFLDIGGAYFLEWQKLKRPPKDLEELKKSLQHEESLVSPRDRNPYAIAWGSPGQPLPALLAWEQTADATGGRWILFRPTGLADLEPSYVDARVFHLLAPPPPIIIAPGKEPVPPIKIQFGPSK
jgi:hypothetical protein